MVDRGLAVAVDRDRGSLVVDRLVDLQLDAAVVADQRRHLERDADVLVGDRGGLREVDAETVVPVVPRGSAVVPVMTGSSSVTVIVASLLWVVTIVLCCMIFVLLMAPEAADLGGEAERVQGADRRGRRRAHRGHDVESGPKDAPATAPVTPVIEVPPFGAVPTEITVGHACARVQPGVGGVGEGDLGDDDLDPHLGEEDVDLVDDRLDQPDVVRRARDDDGVGPLVGLERDQRAELGRAVPRRRPGRRRGRRAAAPALLGRGRRTCGSRRPSPCWLPDFWLAVFWPEISAERSVATSLASACLR